MASGTTSTRRWPSASGRWSSASRASASPRPTAPPSACWPTSRPGCACTTAPSSCARCSTSSRWASTHRTRSSTRRSGAASRSCPPDVNASEVGCTCHRRTGRRADRPRLRPRGARRRGRRARRRPRAAAARSRSLDDLASRAGPAARRSTQLAWSGACDALAGGDRRSAAAPRLADARRLGPCASQRVRALRRSACAASSRCRSSLPARTGARAARRLGGDDRRLRDDRRDDRATTRSRLLRDGLHRARRGRPARTSAACAHGTRVRIGGLVVARQRPGTAKGIVFMLLEDEPGTVNVIVPPAIYERDRLAVRTEPLVLVEGPLERHRRGGGAINILVDRLVGARRARRERVRGRGQGLLAAGRPRAGSPASASRGGLLPSSGSPPRTGRRLPRGRAAGHELRPGTTALSGAPGPPTPCRQAHVPADSRDRFPPDGRLISFVLVFVVLGPRRRPRRLARRPRGAAEPASKPSRAGGARSASVVAVVIVAARGGRPRAGRWPPTPSDATGARRRGADRGAAEGRVLFAEKCSTCHTLTASNAVGRVGPNLDVLRPPAELDAQRDREGPRPRPGPDARRPPRRRGRRARRRVRRDGRRPLTPGRRPARPDSVRPPQQLAAGRTSGVSPEPLVRCAPSQPLSSRPAGTHGRPGSGGPTLGRIAVFGVAQLFQREPVS